MPGHTTWSAAEPTVEEKAAGYDQLAAMMDASGPEEAVRLLRELQARCANALNYRAETWS